jgi:hypothetical protein
MNLVGQDFPALGAAACQHLTAVLRGHSLSETVLFFPLELFRLVGSFHRNRSPFQAVPNMGSVSFRHGPMPKPKPNWRHFLGCKNGETLQDKSILLTTQNVK